jgi:hypothetical protein
VFYSLLALVISVTAVVFIYNSWWQPGKPWVAFAGWLLAFGSALVWSEPLGAELGITFATIIFICLVWLQVAFVVPSVKSNRQAVTRPFHQIRWPSGKKNLIPHTR